jgi:CheY-like chemotaxis protein
MHSLRMTRKTEFKISSPIRTLVADDCEFTRAYLAMLVDGEDGFEVVESVADGREAVRAVTALRPHLILMDVQMPCMDGLTATRIIREFGPQIEYRPIIVIVTGEDTHQCRSDAEEAGANAFVPKSPRVRENLRSTLRNLHFEVQQSIQQ